MPFAWKRLTTWFGYAFSASIGCKACASYIAFTVKPVLCVHKTISLCKFARSGRTISFAPGAEACSPRFDPLDAKRSSTRE